MITEGERRNYTAYHQLIIDATEMYNPRRGFIVPNFQAEDLPRLADSVDQIVQNFPTRRVFLRIETALAFRYPLTIPEDFDGKEIGRHSLKTVGEVLPRARPEGEYGVSAQRVRELVGEGLFILGGRLWRNSATKGYFKLENNR